MKDNTVARSSPAAALEVRGWHHRQTGVRWLSKRSRILAAAALVALLAITGGSVAPAETPATSPRLQEMEQERRQIQQESQDLGGTSSTSRAVANAQQRIFDLNQNIERLQKLAEEFGESTEYLERLAKEASEGSIIGAGDAAKEAAEQGLLMGLGKFCTKAAGRALGWVGLAGDVVEYGGKFVIRDLNEDKIREMLESERVNLNDIRGLLEALYEDKKAEYRTLRALETLAERESSLKQDMMRERQRLAGARAHARLNRDMDSAGDAALEEEEKRYQLDSIRPSNPSSVPPRRRGVSGSDSNQRAMNLSPFAREVLVAHNSERARHGAPPLEWSPALEASATRHANQLARTGRLAHAPREGREIERENLSQGMLDWKAFQMMAVWLNERQHFAPGIFPNVCSGDWSRCGHYTQIIWPSTTDIGCGMAQGSGFNWLVCRYSPGGNKEGKAVGQPVAMASRDC